MNIFRTDTSTSKTAVNGLAVIGFVALVVAGIWLAIYSTRFVPPVVNRIGTAAVYLGSLFTPAPGLSVVPTPVASTTIFFGEASSTISTDVTSTSAFKQNWTPGTPIAINGTDFSVITSAPNYYGLPDLAVTIENVGYGATNDIVSTTTIPAYTQVAVKFLVTNIGTNVSGPWTMNISIPSGGTSANQTFTQESLVPGQPNGFIVHFANITPGIHAITIVIDPNHQLTESNTGNNSISATVTTL